MTAHPIAIPDHLSATVSDTFTHVCTTCGSTIHVEASQSQPHRCRIDLDQRRAERTT